jgi:hypothetical protein
VNVYIHCRWIEIEEKERDGIPPFHERCMIALADCDSDEAAFDCTAIYKNELLRARLPAQTRLPDEPADLNFPRSGTIQLN